MKTILLLALGAIAGVAFVNHQRPASPGIAPAAATPAAVIIEATPIARSGYRWSKLPNGQWIEHRREISAQAAVGMNNGTAPDRPRGRTMLDQPAR